MSGASCVYCGAEDNLTVDHVPPKLLLSRPYPDNLITVPACFPCNQSFQKDDEYMRATLSPDVRVTKNMAAQSNLDAVWRSLRKPEARAFAQYLGSKVSLTTILNQFGNPMGQVMELDYERLERSGQRLVRGLYFSELGTPLPVEAKLKVGFTMGLRSQDESTLTIARVMLVLPDHRERSFGTAFTYMVAIGPTASVWFMALYDHFFWCGTVQLKDGQ